MTEDLLGEQKFELSFLFPGRKEPASAFTTLKDIFKCFEQIDSLFLQSIDTGLEIEYSIDEIGYSSIKTLIVQVLKEVPDEAIRDFDWKKLVGHFLLKLKYYVLKCLEDNTALESKEQIAALSEKIEKEKLKILKNERYLISAVNAHLILAIIEPIIIVASQLKDEERILYRSRQGKAFLTNKLYLNKGKILFELGDRQSANETTEILKIKKIDMLSNSSMWGFKRGTKSITARITDHDWLARFHSREFALFPEDSLKVTLKASYTMQSDGKIWHSLFEITKVIEIIHPDDSSNILSSLF